MKKYKILIISDIKNTKFMEDYYIAKSFQRDGNLVKIMKLDFEAKYDEKFDIIIRRNTWEEGKRPDLYYNARTSMLIRRIYFRKTPMINILGIQNENREYLIEFSRQQVPNTIPTTKRLTALPFLAEMYNTDEFVLKEIKNFDKEDIKLTQKQVTEFFVEGKHYIQPYLETKSQVQIYYVGNKPLYGFEYIPRKNVKYANEKFIEIKGKDKEAAENIAKVSNLNVGMQRIDFVRLLNDELRLTQINDTNINMNLLKLDEEFREYVIDEYKKNIYEFLEMDYEKQRQIYLRRNIYN